MEIQTPNSETQVGTKMVIQHDGKSSSYNAGDPGLIPGSGSSSGGGNGNPLQYFCLGNPMDRGAWWATGSGVAESRTRLSDFTFTITIKGKLTKDLGESCQVLYLNPLENLL